MNAALRRRLATFLLLLTAPAAAAHAQAEPGSELTVYVATFGPGQQVWENFGHNAIWIRDRTTGTTASYNYGMFSFAQEGFVARLLRGRMLYTMWVQDADAELQDYAASGRSVTVQRLQLTPAERHALREFLEWNWLPENREYLYDYFRDNCSTRVRDALDRALGGALRRELAGQPTGTTYRSHSLRLTAASAPTWAGLLLGLGAPTDDPIDAWQETFIPMKLQEQLRTITVTNAAGEQVPLVAEEEVLAPAIRPAPPEQPPGRTAVCLLLGLLLAAAFVLLDRAARRSSGASLAYALATVLWSTTAAFFGTLLAMLWLFTNHEAAYPNANLLLVNPLSWVVAVAAPFALLRPRGRTPQIAWVSAAAVATLGVTALLMALLPGVIQYNAPLIALILPTHLALAWLLYSRMGTVPSHHEDEIALPTPAAAA